jgi:hypothetical protein
MNKLFSRVILSLTVFAGGIFPISAVADLSGSQSGIPGVDYPIIPGVNAPPATGPVESLTGINGPTLPLNPDGSICNSCTLVPLPPPLFNLDGTPFVPGSPLPLPPGSDTGNYKYEYDPISKMYVPLRDGDMRPYAQDPFVGLVPLAPPLFNQDGTPFVPGSPLEMPVRADGTKLEYQWDAASGLYIPVVNGVAMSQTVAIKPFYDSNGKILPGNAPITGSLISVTSIDPLTGKEVQVVYRSNLPPVVNPDGTTNDVNVIGSKPFDLTANKSSIPVEQQQGTWAVIDKNGVVINTIDCSTSICGKDGKLGGKIIEPDWAKGGCPDGCRLVMQVPPNPITGQSMGGFSTTASNKVVFEGGVFKVTSTVNGRQVSRSIRNGVITDVTGERVELSTGIQLPSVIRDASLKRQVDAELRAADITPVKTTRGYQLVTEDQLSAVDSTLRIVAVKKGVRSKSFKLTVDNVGELFVLTSTDLSGYEIQIKRGARTLKSVKVD